MNQLKPTNAYIPVSVEEKPDTDGAVVMLKNGQLLITTYDTGIGFGLSGGQREWLKPTSNVYVLTSEELVKLLGDSFDAGELNVKDQVGSHPSKEQYINSLLK